MTAHRPPGISFSWPSSALVEALVVLVEGAYLRAWKCPRPWLWALLANAFSASVGEIINRLWPHLLG